MLSAARVAETATPVETIERIDDLPRDFFDALNDELRDAITTLDLVVVGRVGVQHHALQFAAVSGVDETRRVHEADAVFQREAAARQNEARVSLGDRDGDAGRHQDTTACAGNNRVVACMEIDSRIAAVRGCRQR